MLLTPSNEKVIELTRSGLIARNTFYSIAGQFAPLAIAVVTIPLLIGNLGIDRFGFLTVSWMIIGYFSLFDFGLSRVLVMHIGEKIGSNREEEIPTTVWTIILFLILSGVAGSLMLVLFADNIISDVLKMPARMRLEAHTVIIILSIAIPIVIITGAFKGIIEVQQRFKIISIINMINGMFTYLVPFVLSIFTDNLAYIVSAMVAARFGIFIAYLFFAIHVSPSLFRKIELQFSLIGAIFSRGGWMTVSNIVSPLMNYIDRFLIGSMISIAAVAYYATPFDVLAKLLIIVSSFTNVLFPVFATSYVSDISITRKYFKQGLKYSYFIMFPIAFIIVTYGSVGLRLWLGVEFAVQSLKVFQWLTIGIFINSFGIISLCLIQATGRPDISAKLHLAELPVYIIMLFALMRQFGLTGAAIAWTLRVMLDTGMLYYFARRTFLNSDVLLRSNQIIILTFILALFVPLFDLTIVERSALFLAVAAMFIITGWLYMFEQQEKSMAFELFQHVMKKLSVTK